MKNSSRRGIEVFDFKPEDELPDLIAAKYQEKFKNSDLDSPSILKYKFLECVAQGENIQDNQSLPCVDVDAVDCDVDVDAVDCDVDADAVDYDLTCGSAVCCTSMDAAEKKTVAKKECSSAASPLKLLIPEENSESGLDNHESRIPPSKMEKKCQGFRAPSPGKIQLNSDFLHSPNSGRVDVASAADQIMIQRSPSCPASEIAENGASVNNDLLNQCSDNMEMDHMNMTVVLYPDFVDYRDSCHTGSQLTFSQSGIKIIGSNSFQDEGNFDFERGIDDLVRIECRWFDKVETVQINLYVISEAMLQDDNELHTSVEELKIVVIEPNWFKKREDLASLNEKYSALWSAVTDGNLILGMDEENSLGQRRYFPLFDEDFEEIVYPKGDSDAVSISRRDVDLLRPETFINDTIIDFYIKYLKNQLQPEERHRFHFFNSFFFRKLADLDKDPSSISDGKAAFQRVRKWTRKIELFGKDFVFIPVNFNLHWSLIVICHPGEVASFKDKDLEKSPKVPCILHMDSIKGNHPGLKNLIQSYLWEEWKERKKETSVEVSSKFHNLRFIPLELPQQENYYDCGLFLLHYLELFLAEAPVNFNPFKINKSSSFLNANWFPSSEASMKRILIQRLIFQLLENRSCKGSSAAFQCEGQTSNSNQNVVGSQFLSESCSLTRPNSSNSQAGQGLEITLLSSSSVKNSQHGNDSCLVLRDLFDPGTTAGSSLEQYQSFDDKPYYHRRNGAISSIQEDPEETEEHLVFLPSGDSGYQQMTGITSQSCHNPYSSRSYEATYDLGMALEERGDFDSSCEPSTCESDDSEVGIIENPSFREDMGEREEENISEERCTDIDLKLVKEGLVSSSQFPNASIVEDPQAHDTMHSGDKNGGSLSSCPEIQDMLAHQDSNNAEKRMDCGDNVQIDDGIVPDSPEQPAFKKLRITHSEDETESINDN